jgi:hypothetical protein
VACQIPKATNTLIIHNVFCGKNGYADVPYCYVKVQCLSCLIPSLVLLLFHDQVSFHITKPTNVLMLQLYFLHAVLLNISNVYIKT